MWCHVCKKLSDTILCPSCEEDLRKASYRYLFTHRCPVCGNPVLDASYTCPFCTEGTLSYGPYGKTLASLIKNYKFGGERSLVPLLSGLYLGLLSSMEHVLILPIPCSKEGYKKRGFDQIEVITSHLAKKRGYPHLSLFTRGKGKQFKTLSKEQRFREQTLQLTRSQRKKERFFQFLSDGYTPVLLDDISTTGTTSFRARELLWSHFGCKATIVVLANA